MSNPSPPARSGPTAGVRILVILLVFAAVGGGAYFVLLQQQENADIPASPVDIRATLREFLGRMPADGGKLADEFADADGDLLADPPADPAKFVNPDLLTFTAVAADDPDKAAEAWRPFVDHLAKTTGKKAVYLKVEPGIDLPPGVRPGPGTTTIPGAKLRPDDEATQARAIAEGNELLRSPSQQMTFLKAGRLHVTAFNTGAVPAAVAQAGFHPLYTPAAAGGTFGYEMRMIVPADSKMQKPEDVKGRTVALVNLTSHSGGRLALAVLKEKFALSPGADYQVMFTGDQRKSVLEVAAKKHAVACVAGDLLDAMIAAGEVKADAVRTVFTSGSYCPLAFGVASTLDPKLRADVQKAFETFAFAGTSVGKQFEAQKRVKFGRVEYKKDYAGVREVDAKLPTLLGGK